MVDKSNRVRCIKFDENAVSLSLSLSQQDLSCGMRQKGERAQTGNASEAPCC